MTCPHCGGNNVTVQIVQEDRGSRTVSHTTSRYREQRHGCLWMLTIGWWWWFVDLLIWIFAFIPRAFAHLLYHVGRKRKYKGKSRTVTTTRNDISYKNICVCQDCGYNWTGNASSNYVKRETVDDKPEPMGIVEKILWVFASIIAIVVIYSAIALIYNISK